MANFSYRIESRPTFRDVAGRFAKANEELIDEARRRLRSEGPVIVEIARKHLRAKTAPYSSAKLEVGIRYNTRITQQGVRLAVTAPGKAGPHRIYARRARALAFNWPKVGMMTFVPKRGGFRTHVRNGALFVGKGYVDHPGGTLKPLMEPIMEKTQDEWFNTRGRVILSRISTRWAKTATG
jgi:hypothetical protein